MPNITSHPRIKVDDLHKSFDGKSILSGINFDIDEGNSFVILGTSGVGKSVLIKCLAGLMSADKGKFFIDGQLAFDALIGRTFNSDKRISYVFQNAALFDSLSIIDNIAFGARFKLKASKQEALDIASEKMSLLGLPKKLAALYPEELSTSQRKSVAVARAIATEPHIIFFDEPSTGLDPSASKEMDQLIIRCVKDKRVTAITITHHVDSAKRIADKIGFLDQGKFIWSGSPDQLENSHNEKVKLFTRPISRSQKQN